MYSNTIDSLKRVAYAAEFFSVNKTAISWIFFPFAFRNTLINSPLSPSVPYCRYFPEMLEGGPQSRVLTMSRNASIAQKKTLRHGLKKLHEEKGGEY